MTTTTMYRPIERSSGSRTAFFRIRKLAVSLRDAMAQTETDLRHAAELRERSGQATRRPAPHR